MKKNPKQITPKRPPPKKKRNELHLHLRKQNKPVTKKLELMEAKKKKKSKT